jgi:hypothetical protein
MRIMTMYWIYDIPTLFLALLVVGVLVVTSLLALFATRPLMGWLLSRSSEYNDVVSYFLSAVGVFYGLALGLIAVATWENFTDVDGLVSKEAASVAGLYNDLDSLPQPLRVHLEERLRDYTTFVISKDWPAQKKGDTLEEGSLKLEDLEDELMAFEPTKERERIAQAEVVKSLNQVVEQRRLRMEAVGTALPGALWAVVIFGAALTVVLGLLFWLDNLMLHAILLAIMATFIGLLIFLTAAMDNPFRGEFSVSADVFQTVLDRVMAARPAN